MDTKDNSLRVVENKNKGLPSEVGGTIGQLVSNEGIDAVIVSDIGPQALEIFDRYGINVYHDEGNINDAIRQLKEEGRLPEIIKTKLQRYMGFAQER